MKRSSEPNSARCSITGRCRAPSLADVAGVEALGQVEVDLERAALPLAPDGVAQHELELRPVERALAGFVAVVDPHALQCALERGPQAGPRSHRSRSAWPAGRRT